MRKWRLHILLTALCVGELTGGVMAQRAYRTDLLERMATAMQLSSRLDPLDDGMYYRCISYQGKPLTVFVRNNRIEHIGYTLFSMDQRSALHTPVFDFIERYWLELNVPVKREKSLERKMAEDDFSFEKGSFASFQSIQQDTTLRIDVTNKDGKRYLVSWYKEEGLFCSVAFPVDYDLLNGSEMLENERRIASEIGLAALLPVEPLLVNPENLLPAYGEDYLILPGESYYLDELNTNKYVEPDSSGTYRLIYRSAYPVESLANLLTTAQIDNQFMLTIRLKKYGYSEELLNVPLNRWTSYCLTNGCKPFFGVISLNDTTAVCELLMRNTDQGYNHVMKLTIDITQLDERKGIIHARLNSYVPTSKIKYLFDEIRQ